MSATKMLMQKLILLHMQNKHIIIRSLQLVKNGKHSRCPILYPYTVHGHLSNDSIFIAHDQDILPSLIPGKVTKVSLSPI